MAAVHPRDILCNYLARIHGERTRYGQLSIMHVSDLLQRKDLLYIERTISPAPVCHHLARMYQGFMWEKEIMREFAWKGPDGSIGEVVITEGPRHPKHALRMEPDTPWVAFYNSELGCGFGGITLNLAEFRRDGGLVRKEYPFMYLAWGPWTYWSRVYTYSYGSNNPQRMIRVPGGSVYYERMAFLPFRLGRGGCPEERFAYIDELQKRLADPLDVRVVMDTDERVPKVPEDWVPPILVEEFEEIEE